jgi:hypothetical protein
VLKGHSLGFATRRVRKRLAQGEHRAARMGQNAVNGPVPRQVLKG